MAFRLASNAARVSTLRPSALNSLRAPVVSLHSSPASFFQKSETPKYDVAAAAQAATEHKSHSHGSYHWISERALSFATLPLIGAAAVVGPNALIDLALGVVIPLHCHIGLDSVIVDYVPLRVYGMGHRIAKVGLYALSGLTVYGLFKFNTNDVGITAFVKRLWTGKL